MKANVIAELENAKDFNEVLSVIDNRFKYTPTSFTNNSLENKQGENEGSLKLLALLKFVNYSDADNPAKFFKEHYDAVLADPDGDSHQNIRHLMKGTLKDVFFGSSIIPIMLKR